MKVNALARPLLKALAYLLIHRVVIGEKCTIFGNGFEDSKVLFKKKTFYIIIALYCKKT